MSITHTGPAPNYVIRQARKRMAGELISSHVHLEVTHHCNLRCLHCLFEPYHHEPKSSELSTSEWAGILNQLFEMGVWYVTFSGGEPLYRPDIFELMDYAKKRGLFFGLKTNGTLITEQVADRLKEMGLTGVDVSLYGATPQTHDHVTGVASSYNKTIHGMKLLRERKIKFAINSSLMKCNVREHKEIGKIAQQLGAFHTADPVIFPKVGQPGSADHIRMDDEQLRTLVREKAWIPSDASLQAGVEYHLLCAAAKRRCDISPQGEVYPCGLWRVPLGNLKQQSFRDIWHGEAAGKIRAIEVNDIQPCASCELVKYCARCPGLVNMETGGISGPSSENCRLARAIKGVREDHEQETIRKPHHRVGTG